MKTNSKNSLPRQISSCRKSKSQVLKKPQGLKSILLFEQQRISIIIDLDPLGCSTDQEYSPKVHLLEVALQVGALEKRWNLGGQALGENLGH